VSDRYLVSNKSKPSTRWLINHKWLLVPLVLLTKSLHGPRNKHRSPVVVQFLRIKNLLPSSGVFSLFVSRSLPSYGLHTFLHCDAPIIILTAFCSFCPLWNLPLDCEFSFALSDGLIGRSSSYTHTRVASFRRESSHVCANRRHTWTASHNPKTCKLFPVTGRAGAFEHQFRWPRVVSFPAALNLARVETAASFSRRKQQTCAN
jgi:hypothetical protein